MIFWLLVGLVVACSLLAARRWMAWTLGVWAFLALTVVINVMASW